MCDWKGIGIAAVLMTAVAQIEHMIEAVLTMGYYMDPQYFAVWSKVMMPEAGPPPASFYAYSVVFGLISAALFAWAYSRLGSAIREKNPLRKGLAFGAIVFLVAGLPGVLSMYLLLNIPSGLLAIWTVSSLAVYLMWGAIASRLVAAEAR